MLSGSSSGRSPTRSSLRPSRPSRCRRANATTTWCSAAPTASPTRRSSSAPNSRRAIATRSSRSATCANQPRLLEDLVAATVPVVALWQGTGLEGCRHRQRRQPQRHRHGRRPPGRPRPHPFRFHRWGTARGHARAADGVRGSPDRGRDATRWRQRRVGAQRTGCRAPMPSVALVAAAEIPTAVVTADLITSPSASCTPPTNSASPVPEAGPPSSASTTSPRPVFTAPPLTTVHNPITEMASLAVDLAIERHAELPEAPRPRPVVHRAGDDRPGPLLIGVFAAVGVFRADTSRRVNIPSAANTPITDGRGG